MGRTEGVPFRAQCGGSETGRDQRRVDGVERLARVEMLVVKVS